MWGGSAVVSWFSITAGRRRFNRKTANGISLGEESTLAISSTSASTQVVSGVVAANHFDREVRTTHFSIAWPGESSCLANAGALIRCHRIHSMKMPGRSLEILGARSNSRLRSVCHY